MSTTLTIGSGKAYATWALAEAAIPSTPTGGYILSAYNTAEYVGTANLLTVSGHTTSPTNFIELTAAAGQSFVDNAGAQTTALTYNQANGVGIRLSSAGYTYTVVVGDSNVTISRLQIAGYIYAGAALSSTGSVALSQCIVQGQRSGTNAVSLSGTFIATNTLFLSIDAPCLIDNGTHGATVTLAGCTVAVASDATGYPIGIGYATLKLVDCALFGGATAVYGYGSSGTIDHCATDQSALYGPGSYTVTNSLTSETYTGQFVGTTSAAPDYRLKTGSALIDAGVTDTTDIPAANDIVGTSRPQGSAWDIGCWELVSGGTSVTWGGMSGFDNTAAIAQRIEMIPG